MGTIDDIEHQIVEQESDICLPSLEEASGKRCTRKASASVLRVVRGNRCARIDARKQDVAGEVGGGMWQYP